MATISLSPSPIPLSTMSTRRLPLTSNPNVANSPLRGTLAVHNSKRVRSHADVQREEAYGQPPPAKRQMIDIGAQARPSKSPSAQRSARAANQRQTSRAAGTDRSSHSVYKLSEKEIENIRQWQTQTRARFPKMVFYFESVPDEQRVKLAKQVTHFGAREEKFFSINITHVVTTRPIPTEKSIRDDTESDAGAQAPNDPPKTIDPSLLNRTPDTSASAPSGRSKLIFDTASNRRLPMHVQDDASRRAKARNPGVLVRAREMGKKIWSLDKLQRILDMVMEPDPYKSVTLGQGLRSTSVQGSSASRTADPSNLLQLLQNERVHGPSDRDPTVASKELNYFKGPYIYVYDIEEKQKPIMVREYAKVPDKKLGDWPQFRVASRGRCPFIEESNGGRERTVPTRAKERVTKPVVPAPESKAAPPPASTLAPKLSERAPPRPVVGKRTLTEMEDAHNRGLAPPARPVQSFDLSKVSNPPAVEFRTENVFTSRAKAGRLFAGEPVASGVQPSNVTSAIRSQMVSSTTGALGVKAGTSKEIHGLQRQVLQKNSTSTAPHDASSRRLATSHDGSRFTRSTSVGRTAQQRLDAVNGEAAAAGKPALRRAESNPTPARTEERKRDPKPGYCENCEAKFRDFDDHIISRKHRKFAEDSKNWVQLDSLLAQLKRPPRYRLDDEDDASW